MGRLITALMVLALAAGSASAQPYDSRNAVQSGDITEGIVGSAEVGRRRQNDQDARNRETRATMVRQTVGRLITDGRCREAVRYALAEGEFDLAERAQRLCDAQRPAQ